MKKFYVSLEKFVADITRRIAFLPLAFRLVAFLLVACSPLSVSPVLSAEPTNKTLPPISQRFASANEGADPESPNFQRHVMALLGRLGCNGRSCHGSFQGRGGFRLSMFGYDFREDHKALLAGEPPRVNTGRPAESLILLKPTDADEHEGGKRYSRDGWEYRVLRRWINAGAKNDADQAGQLVRLEVTPLEIQFAQTSDTAQLTAVAVWNDGTREDVTCLTRFSTNDDGVAKIDETGLVSATGRGDTHLIASYDNAVASIPVMLPVTSQAGDKFPANVAARTEIDQRIVAKLKKLGIVPSAICTDEEFLRRASLDIAGTLPTPDEVLAFVADTAADKRARKVDQLLETPAYALWWSTKFCDITGLNGPLQLGTTEFGPIMTEHWRSWVERKFRDNLAYDKLVEGMVVAISRGSEQSYEEYGMRMTSYVLKKDPVDFTARETMPNFWFRGNLGTADDKALAFAYSFMGVRLDCAQCHKHPFDRWSQQDFKQFAAIFERVRWGVSPASQERYDQLRLDLKVKEMKNAAERRQSYWRWAGEGKLVPWPEVFIAPHDNWRPGDKLDEAIAKKKKADVAPKLLGGDEIDLATTDDPRRPLMDWLRDQDNPYFAAAWVNRVWAHYFGRGLVSPPDDLNLANPPSNGEVFEYLKRGFVKHGYDMKWLHREIVNSDTYQRSWRANESNRSDERNFSRAMFRRLPAEVAVDAMMMATASDARVTNYATVVKDRKIGVQATADHTRTEYSLAVFGKPLRTINCDCEREQQPSLAQVIFVRNDKDLYAMLDRPDGWLAQLAKEKTIDEPARRTPLIRQAFLRVLSREPTDGEIKRSLDYLTATETTRDGLRDLLWALLNTQEFIASH